MEKRVSMLLLIIAVFVLSDVADGKAKAGSEDGDIIDCVDIHKQPAFDHPAMRNPHNSVGSCTMQMRPSFDLPTEKLDTRNKSSRSVILQTWQKSGSCPKGTVPIRRIRKQDLLRAASLEQFGTKPPKNFSASNRTDTKNIISPPVPPSINNTKLRLPSTINLPSPINRSSAILITVGYNYFGAQGDINLWNPTVDLPDDYTTAQIWLKAGPANNFESIEAGWVVNPKLYSNHKTRLFAYWTKDKYKSTGCFDLTCAGFVQTSTEVALGAALYPVSSSGGPQYLVTVGIYQDNKTGHWWLKCGDNAVIGYWPKEMFEYLSHSATSVEWGGEVYSQNVKKGPPHTKTQMGSGSFALDLENSAAYIKQVRIIDDDSLQPKYPDWVVTGSDEENCYSAFNYVQGNNDEPVFFFGGPGQNPRCMVSMLLLLMAVFVLSDVADVKAKARVTLSGIDKKLKILNKPAVKSINSEDGDIIDCVDINKQPAFDHPALRNHKIQMRPSFDLPTEKLDRRNESSQPVIQQTWQKCGSCPEGTVPIRRIRKQDLLRAASLEQFGTKPPNIPSAASNKTDTINIISPPSINNTKPNFLSPINRSSAILATVGYNYIGAQGDINLWNPAVDLPDDYTTGQIWLKGGPGNNFESIEAGWVVNPKLYGDHATRLFAYWTKDAYKTTGCFDITCAGFVQTNPKVALGVALQPLSSSGGPQYYIPIGTYRDPDTENWWLKIGQNYEVVVGYWPKELFGYLSRSAIMVEWGGEVYSTNVKKGPPHTKTQMGSGSSAQTLEGSAASILHVRIKDYSLQLKYPEWVGTGSDESYCYSALNYVPGYTVEPVFYFGGPGQGPLCP
ncbi:hypothetical protein Dsin_017752 [Dipteronia sinensis]|uniref:Neprosin PEP catalytic domain-containing protein n=1 Tax=Dipteronia sinensis TaxID=43782 RepID=A0AAE0AG48_9ROSI|nr:hypothetical protein Dsin_017752 [Dipteronia sinensis]